MCYTDFPLKPVNRLKQTNAIITIMNFDKEEFRKHKYSIVSGLISTSILFLIFHFGNLLGLTDNSKETSFIIIVLFLYLVLFSGTLFVIFYSVKNKKVTINLDLVFRKWVKIFMSLILVIATYGLYELFISTTNQQIPAYLIKIINTTDTIQVIDQTVDLSVSKPVSLFQNQEVDFERGTLTQNKFVKNIILAKKDTSLVTLNFKRSKELFKLYTSEQCELTIILHTEKGTYLTIQGIPFSKSTFENKYSECIIK